jgi:large subunit ribosomal protein L46
MKEPEDWEAAYMEMQEEIAKHGKVGKETLERSIFLPSCTHYGPFAGRLGMMSTHSLTAPLLGQVFPPELNLMGHAAELDRSDDDVLPELPFKLAPRVTKADRLNDRTTLNRALAERLFLLIRGPVTRGRWDLPMAVLEGGGKGGDMKGLSMRNTHEATVRRFMGEKFEAYVPSNAPVGVHWRVPSEPSTGKTGGEQAYGDKVFFYRAQHLKGRGKVVGEGVEEFVWVTREEMGEYLPQASVEEKEYAELLTNIL